MKTQLPQTEMNRLEILTDLGQEIQLDFAGPIKSKSRRDIYILVAIDRFSKWPTAQICKNTDYRTVTNFQLNIVRITVVSKAKNLKITVAVKI